jgi:dynactin complex subunit
MVLFENINLNQRVEVLQDDIVYTGTVKYKGCLNGLRGEWVGVELDLPGETTVSLKKFSQIDVKYFSDSTMCAVYQCSLHYMRSICCMLLMCRR